MIDRKEVDSISAASYTRRMLAAAKQAMTKFANSTTDLESS